MLTLINANIVGIVFYIFLVASGNFGRNVIIFSVDMSSSVYIGNKEKNILIPGKGLAQGLDDATLTAEKRYSINFTKKMFKHAL